MRFIHTADLHLDLLETPEFRAGTYTTDFMEKRG